MNWQTSAYWCRAGLLFVALAVWCDGSALRAQPTLPQFVSDHMVLQRDTPARIWGWAKPGEKVAVSIDKARETTAASAEGRWEVKLPPMKAGGPFDMIVEGSEKRTIKDVLVGEVWFCSGQSNMSWIVLHSNNHDFELANANYPKIRMFTAAQPTKNQLANDSKGEWRVCAPKAIAYWSGVAYFFGRELHTKLDVPVGLIVSSVNGTRIEPWTPASGVEMIPELVGKDKVQNGDLYNAMVHPFTPYTIRGTIWYQGEGNVGDDIIYYHRMRALVGGWRKNWGQGDFPFYYVQIAPLNWGGKAVDVHPQVWDAQLEALKIPNTGMAVTTDIVGHVGDAHPRNKQDVGKRLALWALAKTYGFEKLPYSGPLYKSASREGAKMRIAFDYAKGGLSARDGKALSWFTIAGADGKFVPAQATIDGETLLVGAESVSEPTAVRLGWHQIAQPNLVNVHGLPASPFRTDKK